MTVLVLTEELDPTVDVLVDVLRARDVPVFRADTGWFPTRLALDAELDAKGWTGVLRAGDREVSLVGLRSVWYRRPTAFQLSDGMSGPERAHAAQEARFGLGGVLLSMPVLWVNHPSRQADLYKPVQLAAAGHCGLRTPRTLVSNRADAVRRFAATIETGVVVKPLGAASIIEEGARRPLYTHLLTDADLDDLTGVETTAHLFQQYIDKAYEVRLTVVGDQMFAAAMNAGSQAARVDFRSDYDSLTYRVVAVPDAVAAGVRAFMRQFGLAFGGFDFAVGADGTWWMFECNGGAEYGWIEHATGLPITAAVADLLQKGPQ